MYWVGYSIPLHIFVMAFCVLQYLKNSLIQLTLIFLFCLWNSQKIDFSGNSLTLDIHEQDSTTDRFCIGLCSSVMTVM